MHRTRDEVGLPAQLRWSGRAHEPSSLTLVSFHPPDERGRTHSTEVLSMMSVCQRQPELCALYYQGQQVLHVQGRHVVQPVHVAQQGMSRVTSRCLWPVRCASPTGAGVGDPHAHVVPSVRVTEADFSLRSRAPGVHTTYARIGVVGLQMTAPLVTGLDHQSSTAGAQPVRERVDLGTVHSCTKGR